MIERIGMNGINNYQGCSFLSVVQYYVERVELKEVQKGDTKEVD